MEFYPSFLRAAHYIELHALRSVARNENSNALVTAHDRLVEGEDNALAHINGFRSRRTHGNDAGVLHCGFYM